MKFLFLQATFDEKSKHMYLWCKNEHNDYALVSVPYDKPVFISVSQQQLAQISLSGKSSTRTWGEETLEGFEISLFSIDDELLTILKKQKKIYEHDIDTSRHFLMRHTLKTGQFFSCDASLDGAVYYAKKITALDEFKKNLDVLSFDIETYTPNFSLAPEKFPIIMVGFHGVSESKVFTFEKKSKHAFVETCVSEEEMLHKSLAYIEEKKPDLLVGYNSDRFDFWYLLKRADALNVSLTFNKQQLSVSMLKQKAIRLPGPVHIDLYNFCKNALRTTLKTNSYSLNNVAAEVIGEKKLDVDLGRLVPAWDNASEELEDFFMYNKQDVVVTHKLASVLLENMLAFGEFISIDLIDMTRMGFAMLVEHFLITRALSQKQLIPSLPDEDALGERYRFVNTGAYVYTPTPGLYKDIVVSDFSSLYPTIIVSHNLDPAFVEGKGALGFIPRTIQDLIEARNIVKKELKVSSKTDSHYLILQARSQNLKVLANAMYGYLSFAQSRWYSSAVAQKITAYARYYAKTAIKETQDAGFTVLYADTDSLFFLCADKEKALTHISSLNDKLPGIMQLDVEDFYTSGIFVETRSGQGAKKKYALCRKDGSLKIIGFETVRNDWCKLAREAQKTLLEKVLHDVSKEELILFVESVLARVNSRNFSIEEITLTVKLRKSISSYRTSGPHVAAAKRLKSRGKNVDVGSVVAFVIVQGPGTLSDKTRLPDEVSISDIDVTYYADHQLLPVLESIMEVVGHKQVKTKGGQQTLGGF